MSNNIAIGKGKVSGYVYMGEANSSNLPTSTTSTLTSFTNLGKISEDGVTNTRDVSTENVKDWSGNVVFTYLSEKEDTFQFTLIDSLDENVYKLVYGDDKVTTSEDGEIKISDSAEEYIERSFIFDVVMNDKAKRIVVPCGKVSELGDITYSTDDVVGYEITITCMADADGNTHYEYIK